MLKDPLAANKLCNGTAQQPLGLAKRLVEYQADHQRRFNGEVRVTRLPTRCSPRSRPPVGKRGLIDAKG